MTPVSALKHASNLKLLLTILHMYFSCSFYVLILFDFMCNICRTIKVNCKKQKQTKKYLYFTYLYSFPKTTLQLCQSVCNMSCLMCVCLQCVRWAVAAAVDSSVLWRRHWAALRWQTHMWIQTTTSMNRLTQTHCCVNARRFWGTDPLDCTETLLWPDPVRCRTHPCASCSGTS